MSYALLWTETLLTAIMWVTVFIALTAGMKARWIAVLVVFLAVLVPLAPFAAMVFLTAKLKFQFEFHRDWFAYSTSLLLVYLVGVIILSIRAGRPVGTPPVRFAEKWPRARLVSALLAIVACGVITVRSMERDTRARGQKLKEESRAMIASASAPDVSESQNAAPIYEKAFARLAADKKALIAEDSPLEAEPPDE
ncbi:MAG TPA: hypothetical protein VFC46_15710, partial [Humisphaera sp.]|nr:hypothetical protein [Humisphaera sp.]